MCALAGDGNCCVASSVVSSDNDGNEEGQGGEIVIVVYDSDDVLDKGVVANLEHYGRVAHLQERFTGYGTKWTVLESFMLNMEVHPKDIFVVLDGRDVIANAYSADQFTARITDLLAEYQGKVVSTRYPPPLFYLFYFLRPGFYSCIFIYLAQLQAQGSR